MEDRSIAHNEEIENFVARCFCSDAAYWLNSLRSGLSVTFLKFLCRPDVSHPQWRPRSPSTWQAGKGFMCNARREHEMKKTGSKALFLISAPTPRWLITASKRRHSQHVGDKGSSQRVKENGASAHGRAGGCVRLTSGRLLRACVASNWETDL